MSLRWCTPLFALLVVSGTTWAAKVKGSLSTGNASVGETVIYELSTDDGSPEQRPVFPQVDGLEVLPHVGYGSNMLINPGQGFHRVVTYTYRFIPKREGTITIPAIEVLVGGQKLRTEPITLKVAPPDKTAGSGDFAFGEIRIGRKTAYVGEDLPVELRFHLDLSARWHWQQGPTLPADGFTGRRMLEGQQSRVEVAGKQYGRVTFRTVITPSRAGKLSVGPAPMAFAYSKPQRNRYDPFGGIFENAQELNVTAPGVELDAKPLPVEGRPKDFSGGIGQFRLNATGSPVRVKAGDPVTMTVVISGQGNFDRIEAPTLADPEGWRTYPPADKFEEGDSLGSSGQKTFQFAVVPQTKKDHMPVFTFSYFDPELAKYVTLSSESAPLIVEATLAAATAPVAAEAAPAKPDVVPEDIRPNLPALGFITPGWMGKPAIWFAAMAAPVPVLAGLLIWRARKSDPRAVHLAELRRQRSERLHSVRASADRAEVIEAAVRELQIAAALMHGGEPNSMELGAVLAARRLDGTTSRAVEALFAARTEFVYAGRGRGEDRITANERDAIIETLAAYERNAR